MRGDDMSYVAVHRLKWGDGWIEPGEAVPEGEPGRNYAHLLRLGMIQQAEGSVPQTREVSTEEEAETPSQEGEDAQGVVCPECGVVVANNFALAGHMRSHRKDG